MQAAHLTKDCLHRWIIAIPRGCIGNIGDIASVIYISSTQTRYISIVIEVHPFSLRLKAYYFTAPNRSTKLSSCFPLWHSNELQKETSRLGTKASLASKESAVVTVLGADSVRHHGLGDTRGGVPVSGAVSELSEEGIVVSHILLSIPQIRPTFGLRDI
jgi:hypothetical protein